MELEKYQGQDDDGTKFGFVHADGDGGYFFNWCDTLDETLDSIDVDEIDGDGGLDKDDVIEFLRDKLSGDFHN